MSKGAGVGDVDCVVDVVDVQNAGDSADAHNADGEDDASGDAQLLGLGGRTPSASAATGASTALPVSWCGSLSSFLLHWNVKSVPPLLKFSPRGFLYE